MTSRHYSTLLVRFAKHQGIGSKHWWNTPGLLRPIEAMLRWYQDACLHVAELCGIMAVQRCHQQHHVADKAASDEALKQSIA